MTPSSLLKEFGIGMEKFAKAVIDIEGMIKKSMMIDDGLVSAVKEAMEHHDENFRTVIYVMSMLFFMDKLAEAHDATKEATSKEKKETLEKVKEELIKEKIN